MALYSAPNKKYRMTLMSLEANGMYKLRGCGEKEHFGNFTTSAAQARFVLIQYIALFKHSPYTILYNIHIGMLKLIR